MREERRREEGSEYEREGRGNEERRVSRRKGVKW